jgi:hypothetical protein
MPNADISRLLGEIWRGTSMAEKIPFLEREEAERRMYKAKVEKWKNDMKLERSMKSSPKTKSKSKMKPGSNVKMPDRHQDVATLAQEGTHVSYDKDLGTNSTPSHHEYWYQASQAQFTYPRPPTGPPSEEFEA